MEHPATPSAATPRYQRLADELGEAIHAGRLPSGTRLPSLRQMARQRGLSLNTVIAAYRQLEDAGLVIPRAKAGFEVAARLHVPQRSLRDTASAPTAPAQQAFLARVLAAQARPGVVDLAFAGPRGALFYPGAQLQRHTARELRSGAETVETYARPNGSQRLVAQIVRRGPRLGLHTSADRILLTHGAMEGLQLALRAVTRPGDGWDLKHRPTSTCTPCWPVLVCRPSSCPPIRSTAWMSMRWPKPCNTPRWPRWSSCPPSTTRWAAPCRARPSNDSPRWPRPTACR